MVVLLRCVAETRFSVMFGLSFLQQLAAAGLYCVVACLRLRHLGYIQ